MPDDPQADARPSDIHTPEHRRALRERGSPHGDHIRTDDGNGMDRRPNLDWDTALATALADLREEHRTARMPAPKTTWSMSTIIAAAVGLLAIIGSAATTLQGYTQLGDRLQSFGERMLTMDARVTVLEKGFQDRVHIIDQAVANLSANNTLQDERMQNLTKALEQERQARIENEADLHRADADQRGEINDLSKSMAEIRTDLKVLVDRAQRPRAEMPGVEHDAQVVPGR